MANKYDLTESLIQILKVKQAKIVRISTRTAPPKFELKTAELTLTFSKFNNPVMGKTGVVVNGNASYKVDIFFKSPGVALPGITVDSERLYNLVAELFQKAQIKACSANRLMNFYRDVDKLAEIKKLDPANRGLYLKKHIAELDDRLQFAKQENECGNDDPGAYDSEIQELIEQIVAAKEELNAIEYSEARAKDEQTRFEKRALYNANHPLPDFCEPGLYEVENPFKIEMPADEGKDNLQIMNEMISTDEMIRDIAELESYINSFPVNQIFKADLSGVNRRLEQALQAREIFKQELARRDAALKASVVKFADNSKFGACPKQYQHFYKRITKHE